MEPQNMAQVHQHWDRDLPESHTTQKQMAFCVKEEATRIHHRIHKHSNVFQVQDIARVVRIHLDWLTSRCLCIMMDMPPVNMYMLP